MSGKLLLSLAVFALALLWRGRRRPRGDEQGLRRLGAADLVFLAAALLAADALIPRPQAAPPPSPAAETQAEALPAAEAPLWDLEYGAYLAEACAACHGGAQPGVPALAGRPQAELRAALEAYASGARPHDQMGALARSLSPEERGHVAAWFASRPGP